MKKSWRRLSPPFYTAAALRAYKRNLDQGWWLRGGHAVQRFEATLAALAGIPPAQVVATASCTDALAAAGYVLAVGFGGNSGAAELYPRVCPLTYAGTYSWADGQDWVDCNEEGWPVGPVDVGVELWGRCWVKKTPEEELPTILDAAHRFAPGEVVTAFQWGCKAVCYSFGPQKEVPGVRGGAVLFAETACALAARSFLNNGIRNGAPSGPGRKGYMANAEAAFLNQQLHMREEWRERRQRVLGWYDRYFPQGSDVCDLMARPGEASGHLCVLRFANRGVRDRVREFLARRNVETSIHFSPPEDAPPGVCALAGRILSVPCHHQMRLSDVHRVCTAILRV